MGVKTSKNDQGNTSVNRMVQAEAALSSDVPTLGNCTVPPEAVPSEAESTEMTVESRSEIRLAFRLSPSNEKLAAFRLSLSGVISVAPCRTRHGSTQMCGPHTKVSFSVMSLFGRYQVLLKGVRATVISRERTRRRLLERMRRRI